LAHLVKAKDAKLMGRTGLVDDCQAAMQNFARLRLSVAILMGDLGAIVI